MDSKDSSKGNSCHNKDEPLVTSLSVSYLMTLSVAEII